MRAKEAAALLARLDGDAHTPWARASVRRSTIIDIVECILVAESGCCDVAPAVDQLRIVRKMCAKFEDDAPDYVGLRTRMWMSRVLSSCVPCGILTHA